MRVTKEIGQITSALKLSWALFVHPLHNRSYDRGKDRAAARAANRIAENAA